MFAVSNLRFCSHDGGRLSLQVPFVTMMWSPHRTVYANEMAGIRDELMTVLVLGAYCVRTHSGFVAMRLSQAILASKLACRIPMAVSMWRSCSMAKHLTSRLFKASMAIRYSGSMSVAAPGVSRKRSTVEEDRIDVHGMNQVMTLTERGAMGNNLRGVPMKLKQEIHSSIDAQRITERA